MSARSEATANLRQNVIKQQCVVLHLPTVASQCAPLADQAERERQPYLGYLEALFAAELEDRERRAIERRIKEAHLPRVKTPDEFDFRQAPTVSPTRLSELAEGGYIERAEPVVFIGDSGTSADCIRFHALGRRDLERRVSSGGEVTVGERAWDCQPGHPDPTRR
jgi:DNA replication protein DnaC